MTALILALLGSLSGAMSDRVEMRVGTSVPVAGTSVTVTFVRVRDDSRCPKGVTCIWAGDAVVELRVQTRADDAQVVELHANPRSDGAVSAHGVTLTLERLDPYPEADRSIPAAAYVATVLIAVR